MTSALSTLASALAAGLPSGLTALAAASEPGASPKGSFWMPPAASEIAQSVDHVFYFILALDTLFFVGIVAAMVHFSMKYRRREEGQRTHPNEGNRTIELVWTVIPSILLVVMFLWGTQVWIKLSIPPANAMDVRVNGQKWAWDYDYPTAGCAAVSELVVPVNTPVKLTISSADVLHSFYIPSMRVKKDAVPNRYTVAWFEANTTGVFPIFCAEFCGTDHSRMLSTLRVVSQEEYDAWTAGDCGQGGEGMSPVEYGQLLYDKKGCKACHSTDGAPGVGPTFKGLYGKSETFADGSSVEVDDNYIRESILVPNAKVVTGFQPVMPTFKGKMKDAQINAVIDFIKSLK